MILQTVILTGDPQRNLARVSVDQAPAGSVVTIRDAEKSRTDAQNRLVHKWFADVSAVMIGQHASDIKAECNLFYGRPILVRDDPEWGAEFDYIFDALSLPAKLKAIKVLDIPFTRRMGVKQLNEYMTQMQQDYAELGVTLTDPEARKYERAMK